MFLFYFPKGTLLLDRPRTTAPTIHIVPSRLQDGSEIPWCAAALVSHATKIVHISVTGETRWYKHPEAEDFTPSQEEKDQIFLDLLSATPYNIT